MLYVCYLNLRITSYFETVYLMSLFFCTFDCYLFFCFFFFFQAEDGIRDTSVTGVQTCALPISTLPARELRAGLAEVIKYGLICDAALFGWLEAHLDELLAGAPAALAHVIRRSCEIKAAIVGRDEREVGERALLNLGHTFGHALESATGYKEWLHGEAVGAGLAMAAAMSRECGLMTANEAARVRALL